MRLAVLADIHGNGDALRAVLGDIAQRGGADRLLVLGDLVQPGPDPADVADLLIERDAVAVYGNTERFLLDRDWESFEPGDAEERADQGLSLWVLERLDARAQAWLRDLPLCREMEAGSLQVVMAHGSPRSDRDVIREDTPEETVREMIDGVAADLLLLGHTHEPLDRTVRAVRVINPGAVGYPWGEPRTARYALLTCHDQCQAEFRLVTYDVDKTIARLLAARRPYRLWVVEALRRAAYVPPSILE